MGANTARASTHRKMAAAAPFFRVDLPSFSTLAAIMATLDSCFSGVRLGALIGKMKQLETQGHDLRQRVAQLAPEQQFTFALLQTGRLGVGQLPIGSPALFLHHLPL